MINSDSGHATAADTASLRTTNAAVNIMSVAIRNDHCPMYSSRYSGVKANHIAAAIQPQRRSGASPYVTRAFTTTIASIAATQTQYERSGGSALSGSAIAYATNGRYRYGNENGTTSGGAGQS